MEDHIPKELVREVETIETIKANSNCTDLEKSGIVTIKEVYVGKTTLNMVCSPYVKDGDLFNFLKSIYKPDSQIILSFHDVHSILKQLV